MYGETSEILVFEHEDLIILKDKVRNHYDMTPDCCEWFESIIDALFCDMDEFYAETSLYALLQLDPTYDENEANYLKEEGAEDTFEYWYHLRRALIIKYMVKEFPGAKRALIRVN